tara:strand:+ start:251 stop:451 length:201 start_codon:yes stop_codon:yes gene_type:complete
VNRKKLEEVVRKALKEIRDEGKYQGYARGTFKKMLAKIAQGKNKNTKPFTEDPHTGKSAPPGTGEG